LASALTRNRRGIEIADKDIESPASPAALIARLPFAGFFGDTHDVQPHHGLKIPRGFSI